MGDLIRVAHELAQAARGGGVGVLDRLCAVCARTLPVDGAAIAMMSRTGQAMARSATDEQVAHLEELQFTLGEGPGPAAFAGGRAVASPELGQPDERWPVFAYQAAALVRDTTERSIRAVFAYPLALGPVPFGVLDLYRRQPGELDADLRARVELAVDTLALALLNAAAPTDRGGVPGWLHEALEDQIEVDQAVGMVMVQLGLGAEEAMARLRAHAFVQGMTVGEVAAAVVGRTLRFSPGDW